MSAIQPTQEYRFGIVMYGGVSLAIYMNGITQELLQMVRATAASSDDPSKPLIPENELTGTEAVYRQIGRMLAFGEPTNTTVTKAAPVRTRFVVDVISGTSAGGINGVFLAKALVNNQSMAELKRLWVDEGDVDKLLNDARSVRNLMPMPPADPPKSLLNSRRMYKKLLDAFRGMGKESVQPASLVDDLDLAVTTTDVQGSVVTLRLLDDVVRERRHRNVFRFLYRSDNRASNDAWERNPFSSRFSRLHAFAARCTSAFPFAFEPMTLAQAKEVTDIFPANSEEELTPGLLARALGEDEYDVEAAVANGSAARTRAFTDGGYLDNKPFSHAIDALANRRSRRPVTRKLLYVEPSPELISPALEAAQKREPPNALDNVRAALLGVPRYETIREDLQRILQRNRTANRIGQILDRLDHDFAHAPAAHASTVSDYGKQYLDSMIARYGPAYGGYHRLKIAVLTDRLAAEVGRAVRVDLASDHRVAVRCLVKAWRDARYSDYKNDGVQQPSTAFLLAFDIDYRLRRLDFLLNRIERLARNEKEALAMLRAANQQALTYGTPELRQACAAIRASLEVIRSDVVRGAAGVLDLRGTEEAQALAKAIDKNDLDAILAKFTDEDRLTTAKQILERDNGKALNVFDDVAAKPDHSLTARVAALTQPASQRLKKMVDASTASSAIDAAVRRLLARDFERFEDYDQVMYPVLYATDLGDERVEVDVLRVSPMDAKGLSHNPNRLAGVSLHHFGAFLDADWRRHDITWGRLDGAERIITALLPDPALSGKRDELIRQAHIAIIREQLKGPDHNAMVRLLLRLSNQEARSYARRVRSALGTTPTDAEIRAIVASAWSDDSLYAYFKDGNYGIGPLDRVGMTRVASRASVIVGRLLEDIGGRWGAGDKLAWLTRIARMFWGVVELAIPGSPLRSIGVHILRLFILFSTIIMFAGVVSGNSNVLSQGITWFAVGSALAFIIALVQNAIRGGNAWKGLVVLIVTAITVILARSVQMGLPLVLSRLGLELEIPHLETGIVIAGVAALISASTRYLFEVGRGVFRGSVSVVRRIASLF